MEKLLTIVVPVYNTEKYLRKCLDSLIVPNFLDKLEVLVVIDGSPDNSLSIAQDYEKKYANTFRVINKENGGHGSCCNVGLKEAKGKYIRFLDSDDWFDAVDFSKFLIELDHLDVDLVQNELCYEYVFRGQTCKGNIFARQEKKIWDAREFDYSSFGDFMQLPCSTYKTETFRATNIHFTEKVAYDDVAFFIHPFKTVKTIYCLNLNVYHYFIGRPGQSIGSINERLMTFRKNEYVKLCESYMEFRMSLSKNQIEYSDRYISKHLVDSYFKSCLYMSYKSAKQYFYDWEKYVRGLNFIQMDTLHYYGLCKQRGLLIMMIYYKFRAFLKNIFQN